VKLKNKDVCELLALNYFLDIYIIINLMLNHSQEQIG